MDKSDAIAGSLRAHRAMAKITQAQLSEATGFNAATISAWENRAGISFADAWDVADYYGVSLDDLAGRKFPA